ncbi:MAG TPA: methyltransferase [Gammaproteobacteria bacterium]|jgi:predicted methyltransferase
MRLSLSLITIALGLPLAAAIAAPAASLATPAYVTAAINDPARKDDAADDARRHPAEVMTFSQVRPGQKVVELVPGEGYWTRIFSGIVGAQGHVYTVWPNEMSKYATKSIANWQGLVAKPPYTNVSILQQPGATLTVSEPVDLVFTSQNYHDYHDKFMGPVDMASFDKQVFNALKPGGLFVVVDHTAVAGSGFSATDTLHRVDPEAVKKEVEAAGFVLDGESDALKNPADTHMLKVFDPSIRGKTDQFILRFKKPAH